MVYLRNAGANDTEFTEHFVSALEDRRERIEPALPGPMAWTGNRHNVLEGSYDIRVDEHDDIFEAYVDALHRAMTDHVIEADGLVDLEESDGELLVWLRR